MATVARYTLLFAVTTDPADRAAATGHSGGWSESQWGTPVANFLAFTQQVAQRRANMLPLQAACIGWRYETFDLTGRKLTPQGGTSGRFQYPGMNNNGLNLPQDALMISGTAAGNPNSTRFTLRALPDDCTKNGEYQPTANFSGLLQNYLDYLKTRNYGFVGRNKTSPSSNVISIAAGVVKLNANIGGVGNTDYLRLNRVKDVNGNAVKGSFLITSVAGAEYTVAGLAGVSVTIPSGSARLDALTLFTYGDLQPNRAVTRKIGRPFEQYRGRASRRA